MALSDNKGWRQDVVDGTFGRGHRVICRSRETGNIVEGQRNSGQRKGSSILFCLVGLGAGARGKGCHMGFLQLSQGG